MKSGRQRRSEIAIRRQLKQRAALRMSTQSWAEPQVIPRGALPAEPSALLHDNTYGPRPRFYADRPFDCIECGAREVWTAAQQKWWHELAKGKIASTANRCSACRYKRRLRRSQERRIHIEGLIAKLGPEAAAARLGLALDALDQMRLRWLHT